MNAFLSIVPKSLKVAAAVIFAIGVIVGPLVGYFVQYHGMDVGVGLLVGTVMCLGYVYEDARRR